MCLEGSGNALLSAETMVYNACCDTRVRFAVIYELSEEVQEVMMVGVLPVRRRSGVSIIGREVRETWESIRIHALQQVVWWS